MSAALTPPASGEIGRLVAAYEVARADCRPAATQATIDSWMGAAADLSSTLGDGAPMDADKIARAYRAGQREALPIPSTPAEIGAEIRRLLMSLRAPTHTADEEHGGLRSYGTDALRREALDHAGFCWAAPGEMAPGCCCDWSIEKPEGPREKYQSRKHNVLPIEMLSALVFARHALATHGEEIGMFEAVAIALVKTMLDTFRDVIDRHATEKSKP